MSYFKFNDKNIYFEVHGSGKTLIMLNGIMMSHLSWKPYLDILSKNRQVILLDFLDQGKSDKAAELYEHDTQVNLVRSLVNHLELSDFDLFGISYGGQVALQYAIKYNTFSL